MNEHDIIVVGGGAAGMIAAGFAAQNGARVLVVEKMPRPARKILVTGKGRCNLTNDCNTETFIKMVKTNPRFLYSAYSNFSAQDTMALFENLGIRLKTERGSRVYPVSEKAMDIADAMVRFAKQNNVSIVSDCEVQEILAENGLVKGVLVKGGVKYYADSVILATGGSTYPGTGSTGDGYRFAENLGHTIVPLRPSLIALVTKEQWAGDLMGLSLKNIALSLYRKSDDKIVYKDQGEMMFTHFGISGPLVLSASSYIEKPDEEYYVSIDLKPALDLETLDARLIRDFETYKNKDFDNSLFDLLPRALVPIVVKQSEIFRSAKVNQITKEQRFALARLIKGLKLEISETRPMSEAVVTAGGVSVKEIEPKTMQSKLVKGLYFAGEVIDLDAFTGGFNLQIAFSTGHAAGVAAANNLRESL